MHHCYIQGLSRGVHTKLINLFVFHSTVEFLIEKVSDDPDKKNKSSAGLKRALLRAGEVG